MEKILDIAGCKIISEIENEHMTAYLLRYIPYYRVKCL